MDKNEVLKIVSEILSNNINQKLTIELANGIAFMLRERMEAQNTEEEDV